MRLSYNEIAGQSVERLAALSDGIFAVSMTLLVLDLHTPTVDAIHSEHDLWHALVALGPYIVMYLMSFLTLGIFWVGQQTQLNHLGRAHRSLVWIHILFLFAITLMPFSTLLLAQFYHYRVALLVYWLNICLAGIALYFSWNCAKDLGLVKADMPAGVTAAIQRRILIAQALYAFGAVLCVVSPELSVAFILIVQLYYAIAPRIFRKKQAVPSP